MTNTITGGTTNTLAPSPKRAERTFLEGALIEGISSNLFGVEEAISRSVSPDVLISCNR